MVLPYLTVFCGAALICVAPGQSLTAAEQTPVRSHPPMRPLPVPSNRPPAAGPGYFVNPVKGDDRGDGSRARPWKTIEHAVRRLKPGDTLYLRDGTYYEHVTVSVSGTAEKPVTIRAYPNELAVLDGGLREFFEEPARAWEPCPAGVAGEYWSVKPYPDLGGSPGASNILGRFGDSMNPLHGYRFLSDLRSANEYWNIENKTGEDAKGIYCGPGVYYDLKTGRIHVRLAHTTLKALGDDNYRGETDPRKLPLVVAGLKDGPPLALRGVQHVHLQDLVVRGTRTAAVEIADSANVLLDGVTAYGGASAIQVRDTAGLRVGNTACRGIAAPWTFRGSLKYRAIEARLFSASGWIPTGRDNRDFELAYSEFTDSVDGVFLGNVHGVRFHHNLVDNVSDDGIFLTAGTAFDGTTPGGDVHITQNLLARCLTTFAFGVGHGRQKAVPGGKQTGSGVHVARNVFDYRRSVPYHIPAGPEGPQEITSYGRVASDHGSPAWEPIFFYHNTVVSRDAPFRGYYGAGLAGHLGGGARRRMFNNIFTQVDGLPGNVFTPPPVDFQADGNLHWGVTAGPEFKGDFLAKFRQSKLFAESKTHYKPGWAAADRFADPRFDRFGVAWTSPLDLRPGPDSPAIDMGVTLPTEWPDPLRAADRGAPDAGALPLGAAPWRVGVKGRLTIFGAAAESGAAPAFEPVPFRGQRASQGSPGSKPAALVEGYPAFDAPLVQFALRQQGIPVETFDRTRGWLTTTDYEKYGVVVVVGSLVRAKMEPNKYGKEDLERVRAFLEHGGTLLLMRVGLEVFGTPPGRDFLAGLTGASPGKATAPPTVLRPAHPWIKHLNPNEAHPWVTSRLAVPLRVKKGETILGAADGQATLYRLPVGRGQIIYMGWEMSEFLPAGKAPSTPEKERVFEEQVQILQKVVADLYPLSDAKAPK